MHPGAIFLCAQMECGKRFKTRNAIELHRSTVGHVEAPFQGRSAVLSLESHK